MISHKTTYRIIYGDTDKMGYAYNANYLRWFEMGRTEMFRSSGLTYKEIEEKGIFLPVSEVFCKFISPVHYDDLLIIETSLDSSLKAGMKFDYKIFVDYTKKPVATGYTKHPYVNLKGKVVRPPEFLAELIKK